MEGPAADHLATIDLAARCPSNDKLDKDMTRKVRTWQILVVMVATSLFVALSMYLDGYLTAVPYPSRYVDLARAHKPLGLYLWWSFERAVPDAALAARRSRLCPS